MKFSQYSPEATSAELSSTFVRNIELLSRWLSPLVQPGVTHGRIFGWHCKLSKTGIYTSFMIIISSTHHRPAVGGDWTLPASTSVWLLIITVELISIYYNDPMICIITRVTHVIHDLETWIFQHYPRFMDPPQSRKQDLFRVRLCERSLELSLIDGRKDIGNTSNN